MNPAFSAAHLRTFLPLFQRIAGKVRPIVASSPQPCLLIYGSPCHILAIGQVERGINSYRGGEHPCEQVAFPGDVGHYW